MRTVAACRFPSIRGDADAWRLTRRSCSAQAVLSSQGVSLGLPNGVVVGEHDARRIQLLGDRLVRGVP